VTRITLDQLREQVGGDVIAPGNDAYDEARTVYNAMIDRHPAVVVRAASVSDVTAAVNFARENGLDLAVRGGGHSVPGFGTCDDGVALDLSGMRAVTVDPKSRTARAEGGATWGDFNDATHVHGLATTGGIISTTGVGGLTLGGGIGYLARGLGLSCDNLISADVVTADGELLRASAQENEDLFWAIRGGGGNFGVATRFRYRLHPLDGIVGGMLILPATPDVVAGFIAEAVAAPDELSTIANVMPCPPMPFVPEERHGELVVLALLAYTGDAAAGERAIAPLRALAEPLADLVRPMPYPEIYPPDDPDYHPMAVSRTMFLDRIDRDVARLIVDRLEASDASMRVAQLRVLGGAMARIPADATAFAHRTSRIMVNLAAFYDGPDDKLVREAWVAEFVAVLEQEDRGAYVNFLGDEGDERIRAAYPGSTWDRLAAVKARYDPTNLFRLNQNVPPAVPE
jgi:FAD/FMN-containing dehydrogenase